MFKTMRMNIELIYDRTYSNEYIYISDPYFNNVHPTFQFQMSTKMDGSIWYGCRIQITPAPNIPKSISSKTFQTFQNLSFSHSNVSRLFFIPHFQTQIARYRSRLADICSTRHLGYQFQRRRIPKWPYDNSYFRWENICNSTK
jgi:hypothetical protein